MRIAFCNRPTWNNPLGGDGVQMLKTKEALEKIYGLEINIVIKPEDINRSYDIVHIFNYATKLETQSFFDAACDLGLKIVSSPIFWEYKYAITPILHRLGWIHSYISKNVMDVNIKINHGLAKLFSTPYLLTNDFKRNICRFIELSDVILPNSEEEGKLLLKFSGLSLDYFSKKMQVVYNGVDKEVSNSILSSEDFHQKYSLPSDYVLQVSRIQYLKNQLNLLKALENCPQIPIVFVGKVIERSYFEYLRKIASRRGNVYFISEIPHEDIYSFYHYAKLHVLLSFRESPGLVSLEALSQGCPIVVADDRFLPIHTYFNNVNAKAVDPFDLNAIRSGVFEAYKLKERANFDVEKFSWNNVALQTYTAYKSICS